MKDPVVGVNMSLDKYQRLVLLNQYSILEKLDPQNEQSYQRNQEILSNGFENEYHHFMDQMSEPLSITISEEVINILDMFWEMQKIVGKSAKFYGFDGNYERDHYGYMLFVLKDRFTDLQFVMSNGDKNSHYPHLDRYRKMLIAWNAVKLNIDWSEINKNRSQYTDIIEKILAIV